MCRDHLRPRGPWGRRVADERLQYKPQRGERHPRATIHAVEAVKGLKSAGVDVVGYGMNAPQTDHRAPYDFFCVYRVPNVEVQRQFEQQVAASGWYEYFEQVKVSGEANDFEAVLLGNAKMARPASS